MPYIPQSLRSVLAPLVTWTGRRGIANTMSSIVARLPGINGQTTTRNASANPIVPYYAELWNLFLTPYIWRGVLSRDISRLWTGAKPITDEDGNELARAQIINPHGQQSEQLDLLQWNIDEYLDRDMKQVLEQVCASKIIFGKAVQEIVWERQGAGDHKGKVLIKDFKDVDPTLFQVNPKNQPPGLYMQKVGESGTLTAQWEKVDERRFWIVTNHQLFDDQNGISELEPLRKTEPRRAQAESDWGRGVQRAGQGHIIGKMAKRLRGAAAKPDRDEFLEALKQMSADTVTAMDEENQVEVLEPHLQDSAFSGFIDELKMQISLVLTGSPTTLKEGKYGNQSMAESTIVRQESNLEIADASDISGSFTEQVIVRFCDFNWANTPVYPFMQIVSPILVTPTTPEEQKNQTEIEEEEEPNATQEAPEKQPETPQKTGNPAKDSIIKESIIKLQEPDEQPQDPEIKTPPVAVPPTYTEFPDTEPEPDIYQEVLAQARKYLQEEPVKNYPDVTAEEAPYTFTLKRLRSYKDAEKILVKLKDAILPTLAAKTEDEAWRAYYKEAVNIFADFGLDMGIQMRDDLIISFRQARQNSFGRAILEVGKNNPDVIGFRLETRRDNRVRPEHKSWDNVVLAKDNPLLQRLACPMDFACRCNWMPVYAVEADTYPITPENKLPRVMPGDSYKYYAPKADAHITEEAQK